MSETPAYVEAELNYLRPSADKPVNYAYPPPAGVPLRTGEPESEALIRSATGASKLVFSITEYASRTQALQGTILK